MVLLPTQTLYYLTTIHIQVGPLIPSLEGPLCNPESFNFTFTTLPKFGIDSFTPTSSPKRRLTDGWVAKATFTNPVLSSFFLLLLLFLFFPF